MHILGIKTNNFMRLGLIELSLNGKNLIIGGKNEQGKSSLLNAFWVALGGADAMDALEISRPVRKGEARGEIELDLGDIIVSRKWIINTETDPEGKSPNMYLEVKTKEGAKYPSPQKMLDALMGKMFDPFEFSEMKATAQRELLLKLVDLGEFSLDANAAARKALYERRTEVNREVTRLDNVLKVKAPVGDDVPDDEVSSGDILQEMTTAQDVKKANDAKRRQLSEHSAAWYRVDGEVKAAEEKVSGLEKRIEELKQELADANLVAVTKRKERGDIQAKGVPLNEEVKALQDPDLSIFEERLRNVETVNVQVRAKRERAHYVRELADVRSESDKLTSEIKALDQAKETALKAARFPVDGLSIDDEGITFNGVPFGQCSTEEKMRVCVAIAMSMSPKLKVIRISRAESLDQDNFRVIQEMAAAGGYQLLMEKVGDPGEMGIVIEDGAVKVGGAA